MMNPRAYSRRACAVVVSSAAAVTVSCSTSEVHVEVHASFHDAQPFRSLEISALPFDPDDILDSLARASATPRPEFSNLQVELSLYHRPDERHLREIGTSWRATRDSVQRLADSLNGVAATSRGYAAAYARLRELYRRLSQRAAERDAAFRERIGDDRQLALRAAQAADSLRQWERIAFADFPTLADSALLQSGQGIHRSVTNTEGTADFFLPPGQWWLIARRTDPDNPFSEYYWNVPAVLSAVGPSRIPLHRGNAVVRWRH